MTSTSLTVSSAPPTSFADGFETGNVSGWSAVSGAGLSVSTAAALSGVYGLAVTATRTGGSVRGTVPGTTGAFNVRILANPRPTATGPAMATGSAVVPLLVQNAAAGPVASLEYRLSSGATQVRVSGRTSTGALKSGAWITVPQTATSVLEIDGQPSSGTLTFYVADVAKYSLTGLSTNRIPASIDVGLVGAQPTSVSGGVRLDAVVANRSTHIGTATGGL